MCSVTTGSAAPAYSESGMNGSIASILFPINHGILYFTGFTVIEPFVVHSPRRLSQQERDAQMQHYRQRIVTLETAPVLRYRTLGDYDDKWVLKEGA